MAYMIYDLYCTLTGAIQCAGILVADYKQSKSSFITTDIRCAWAIDAFTLGSILQTTQIYIQIKLFCQIVKQVYFVYLKRQYNRPINVVQKKEDLNFLVVVSFIYCSTGSPQIIFIYARQVKIQFFPLSRRYSYPSQLVEILKLLIRTSAILG